MVQIHITHKNRAGAYQAMDGPREGVKYTQQVTLAHVSHTANGHTHTLKNTQLE